MSVVDQSPHEDKPAVMHPDNGVQEALFDPNKVGQPVVPDTPEGLELVSAFPEPDTKPAEQSQTPKPGDMLHPDTAALDQRPLYGPPSPQTEAVTPPPAKRRLGRKVWMGIGAGLLSIGAIGAGGIAKSQSGNSAPTATTAPAQNPGAAPANEAPTTVTPTSAEVSSPTTVDPLSIGEPDPTVPTPVTQPPGHLPFVESEKGKWPKNVVTLSGVGNFRMGMSAKDLVTFGYDVSKHSNDQQNTYDITDESGNEVIVTIDDTTGEATSIQSSSINLATPEGIRVGSTKADVEKAYSGNVQSKQLVSQSGSTEALVLQSDETKAKGAKFVFGLDQDGKVSYIDILGTKSAAAKALGI